MISFELARGHDAAVLFIEALALVTNAVSLVGVDTLPQHLPRDSDCRSTREIPSVVGIL